MEGAERIKELLLRHQKDRMGKNYGERIRCC